MSKAIEQSPFFSSNISRQEFLRAITAFCVGAVGLLYAGDALNKESNFFPSSDKLNFDRTLKNGLPISYGTHQDLLHETGMWSPQRMTELNTSIGLQKYIGIFTVMESYKDEAWVYTLMQDLLHISEIPMIAIGVHQNPFSNHPFDSNLESIEWITEGMKDVVHFLAELNSLSHGKPVILRPFYEMNENSFTYGPQGITQQNHIKGYQRSILILDRLLRESGIRSSVDIMFSAFADQPFEQYAIQDNNNMNAFDSYGLDAYIYAKNSFEFCIDQIWPFNSTQLKVVNSIQTISQIASYNNKPWGLSEVGGLTTLRERTAWVMSCILYAFANEARYFCYFDFDKSSDKYTDQGNYMIDSQLMYAFSKLFQTLSKYGIADGQTIFI